MLCRFCHEQFEILQQLLDPAPPQKKPRQVTRQLEASAVPPPSTREPDESKSDQSESAQSESDQSNSDQSEAQQAQSSQSAADHSEHSAAGYYLHSTVNNQEGSQDVVQYI